MITCPLAGTSRGLRSVRVLHGASKCSRTPDISKGAGSGLGRDLPSSKSLGPSSVAAPEGDSDSLAGLAA
jgi:hypothetical protein